MKANEHAIYANEMSIKLPVRICPEEFRPRTNEGSPNF